MKEKETIEEALKLETYFSFKGGVEIPEATTKKRIEECIKTALERCERLDLKESFSTISSGCQKVFVEAYKQANKKYTVYITISRDYKQKTFTDIEAFNN